VSSEGHPQQEPAVWARQRAPTAGVRGHCPAEDTLADHVQRCQSKRPLRYCAMAPATIVLNALAEIFSGSNGSPALFITPLQT
jgi:hypothetical protein